MKKIIEYVPIITVCLIYFGFCNLHYYYKEFNIDIYNYISNTEILLSFLPTIVVLASSIYIIAYSKLINHSDLNENDKKIDSEEIIEKEIRPKERKIIWSILLKIPVQLLLLIICKSILSLVLINYYAYKAYELQDLNIIYALVFLAYIYFSSSIFKNQKLINDNILLITFFSVLYLGIQIGTYRKLDSDKIKDGISNKKIEFEYDGKKIETSKQNIYIGQTQSHLFIFNIKNKSTSIYKTENIELLTLK